MHANTFMFSRSKFVAKGSSAQYTFIFFVLLFYRMIDEIILNPYYV